MTSRDLSIYTWKLFMKPSRNNTVTFVKSILTKSPILWLTLRLSMKTSKNNSVTFVKNILAKRGNLTTHVKNIYKNFKEYQCSICQKYFISWDLSLCIWKLFMKTSKNTSAMFAKTILVKEANLWHIRRMSMKIY